jgi:hypothetical protein
VRRLFQSVGCTYGSPSALSIVSLAPLFGDPLMADASEVSIVIAPKPRCREHENRDRHPDAQEDPPGIQERRSVSAGAIAGAPSHGDMTATSKRKRRGDTGSV